jgi:hypothetical protein
MRKHTIQAGLISAAATFAVFANAAVFALPAKGGPVHSPEPVTPIPNSAPTGGSDTTSGTGDDTTSKQPPVPGPTGDQHRLAAPQLQTCQGRATAITAIMKRIDTRTQNQFTLFGTVAANVESFYTSSGKAVSNYDQLVAAIATAKGQAQTDLTTLQTASTIDCSGSDPKGQVTAFQSDLKTEMTDLQSYRSAIKDLIKAVAAANGVTVSSSSQTSATGGQQ